LNSNDFVFDNQMIAQIFHAGFQIGELTCPTHYFDEASSISLKRSIVYGVGVLRVSLLYGLKELGIYRHRIFDVREKDMPANRLERSVGQ
jgi:hypothetical protein